MSLDVLGWSPEWARAFAPYREQGYEHARVITSTREHFTVMDDAGERHAILSGRFRYEADLWPVTGDWVVLDEMGRIVAVLPRRTLISRKEPGRAVREQVLVSNVDVAFLVTALDGDFNVRRIVRYLDVARAGGVRPVIVLNKADVCPDVTEAVAQVRECCTDEPIIPLCALSQQPAALLEFVRPGETAVLLGSSGAGKSTITNALCGYERARTNEVREDDSRGRHTTTIRELIALPGGWALIDTPGLREVQAWQDPNPERDERLEAWLRRRDDPRAAEAYKRMCKSMQRNYRSFVNSSPKRKG